MCNATRVHWEHLLVTYERTTIQKSCGCRLAAHRHSPFNTHSGSTCILECVVTKQVSEQLRAAHVSPHVFSLPPPYFFLLHLAFPRLKITRLRIRTLDGSKRTERARNVQRPFNILSISVQHSFSVRSFPVFSKWAPVERPVYGKLFLTRTVNKHIQD